MFDLVDAACSPQEIREIGTEYDDEDQEFFNQLAVTTEKSKLFEDAYASGKVKQVSYILTDRCNLCCTHCSYSAKFISSDDLQKIHANTAVLRRIIELSPEEISVTGGEPLLADNFAEVMEILNTYDKGRKVLCTNATRINADNAEALCKCFDVFDISLDGHDEATADAIRGKGVFQKVLRAITLLQAYRAKQIKLSCAIRGGDERAREAFTELCEKIGVIPVIRRMSLSGRAAENQLDDSSDMSCFLTPTILSCYECGGGRSMLTVDWNGDVFPCNNFTQPEYKIGNLSDGQITSHFVWDDSENWFRHFSEFLPDKREECRNCEVNLFCWNCPSIIRTFLESRNLSSLNAICAEKKKQLMEGLWGE